MKLSGFSVPKGAVKKRKRVGRGPGSGHGKTSGKGHKGQNARTGGGVKPGFEGGSMPLVRRTPKRGFFNNFAVKLEIVNAGLLENFEAGSTVTLESMKEKGMVRNSAERVKVLGVGDLSKALTVKAHSFSASAREKIEKAGGKTETIR